MKIIKKDFKKRLAKDIKDLLRKKKKKKWQYGHEKYTNLAKDEIQKLVECKRRCKMKKNTFFKKSFDEE